MVRKWLSIFSCLCLYFVSLIDALEGSPDTELRGVNPRILYGVRTAKLTEAVIAAYNNDTQHATSIIAKNKDTLLYPDFKYTTKLLNIRQRRTVHKIEETIHAWLNGDYSTQNTEFSILLDEYLVGDILASPETLTRSGLLDKMGEYSPAGYWDTWPSASHFQLYGKRMGKFLDLLKRDDLTFGEGHDNKLFEYHNLKWFLEVTVEFHKKWSLYGYTVSQLGSLQSHMISMTSVNLRTKSECAAWIKRLQTFRQKYNHYKEHFMKSAEINMNPPNFVIEKVITSTARVLGALTNDPYSNPLMSTLVNNYKHNLQQDLPDELKEATAQAIKDVVVPVLKDFSTLLSSVIKKDKNVAGSGLWSRPNGTDYYSFCVKKYTTTSYTAEQLHQLGVVEVAKIRKQIKSLVKIINQKGDNLVSHFWTTSQIFAGIRNNEAFYYNNTDKEGVISSLENIMSIVRHKMKDYFTSTKSMAIEVQAMSPEDERSQPIATYTPADEFTPVGTFNVNMGQKLNKIVMRSLVCHETFPGHHFHLSRILSRPSLRKLNEADIRYSSSLEGWAMYSEQLCSEMGVMDVPTDDLDNKTSVLYYSIGRLTSEIFRAVRLVVDTGIHTKKWTRHKAIKYMQHNTDAPLEMIKSEVSRYIVWPGQALSYYTGLMEMNTLRSEVMSKEGQLFDIKDFHDTILNSGSLPLTVLRKYVAEKYGLNQL